MSKRRTLVLDTSAFIAGFDPYTVKDDLYSVPAVGQELAERSLFRLRFYAAVDRGALKVCEPRSHYVRMIKESSKEIGDMLFLSKADMQVLALAMQLKDGGGAPTIVTDDYAIQNVAEKIKVDYVPLVTFGIRFHLQWLLYCPACRKNYPSDYRLGACQICGTQLKRKPLTKKPVVKDDER